MLVESVMKLPVNRMLTGNFYAHGHPDENSQQADGCPARE